MRWLCIAMSVLLLSAPLSGCTEKPEHTLTVLAAASLTEPFEEFVDVFEHEHPDVHVEASP